MDTILQIIDARERYYRARIGELEAEVEHWKQKWWEQVDSSIKHSEAMMGNIVKAALAGAIGAPSETTQE